MELFNLAIQKAIASQMEQSTAWKNAKDRELIARVIKHQLIRQQITLARVMPTGMEAN